jgi:hypothetical protein
MADTDGSPHLLWIGAALPEPANGKVPLAARQHAAAVKIQECEPQLLARYGGRGRTIMGAAAYE